MHLYYAYLVSWLVIKLSLLDTFLLTEFSLTGGFRTGGLKLDLALFSSVETAVGIGGG